MSAKHATRNKKRNTQAIIITRIAFYFSSSFHCKRPGGGSIFKIIFIDVDYTRMFELILGELVDELYAWVGALILIHLFQLFMKIEMDTFAEKEKADN